MDQNVLIFKGYYINLDAVTHIYYDEKESNVVVGLKTGYLFEIPNTSKYEYNKLINDLKKGAK